MSFSPGEFMPMEMCIYNQAKVPPVKLLPVSLLLVLTLAACSGDAGSIDTTTTTAVAAPAVTTTTAPPATTTTTTEASPAADPAQGRFISYESDLGFTLEYPRQWRTEEVDGIVTFYSPTNGPDTFAEFVEVYTLDAADLDLIDPTATQVMELLAADIALTGEYGEIVFVEEGPDIVDGELAYGVAMQGSVGDVVYTLAYAASIHNGTIYIMGFQATDEVLKYFEDFNRIADSFVWTD